MNRGGAPFVAIVLAVGKLLLGTACLVGRKDYRDSALRSWISFSNEVSQLHTRSQERHKNIIQYPALISHL